MDRPAMPHVAQIVHPAKSLLLCLLMVCLALALTSCGRAQPVIPVPTVDCGTPMLEIGSTKFRIETLKPQADGSVKLPADTAGVAYWLDGTTTNQVFLIGAAPDNLKIEGSLLPSIEGATATVTWQNCNSTDYTLGSVEDGSLAGSTHVDQSSAGITVVFQEKALDDASVVRGTVLGETITTISTPASDASSIQAEITLLDTTTSADGKTVRIGVSILNTGKGSFTLSATDVSLVFGDGKQGTPMSSEPSLPRSIKRGATQTIYFTFERPSSETATLKVLDVEYDIEGY